MRRVFRSGFLVSNQRGTFFPEAEEERRGGKGRSIIQRGARRIPCAWCRETIETSRSILIIPEDSASGAPATRCIRFLENRAGTLGPHVISG